MRQSVRLVLPTIHGRYVHVLALAFQGAAKADAVVAELPRVDSQIEVRQESAEQRLMVNES